MTFAIGVVAHASRTAAAEELADTVAASFVSIDSGSLGCDGNHALVHRQLAEATTEFAVILEDDALPVSGFRGQLAAALEVAPDVPVVSLYLGRSRPASFQSRIAAAVREADQAGACWLTASTLLHAVGYVVRTELLPSLLEFESERPVDDHVGAWASRVAYCWPSLVDHLDGPTAVAHPDGQARLPGRRAWRVGSRNMWTGRSVALTA